MNMDSDWKGFISFGIMATVLLLVVMSLAFVHAQKLGPVQLEVQKVCLQQGHTVYDCMQLTK
jgi:hypothetical protein